ncbi:MAG: GbsR/MarR family transcriptional regulator, partial [Candidatus Ratteibacteria bacterium]
LSPTEIGKFLEMSKGNVSINLRTLEQWNAVKKVWRKGYSRALYTANENIEEIILNKLKTGLEKRLSYAKPLIEQVKQKNKVKSNDDHFTKKINQIEKLISKIEFFLDNFETIKSMTVE